jgi:Na+-translocating ferredoxin:NAD+ oxidoreductase RnfD subunit
MSTADARPETSAGRESWKQLGGGFDPRWLSAGLLTLILVVGQWFFGIIGSYERMLLALGTALATEYLLSRWMRGMWPNPLSAYVSGNSVVILTKPPSEQLWMFPAGAFLSIASKYVLTWKGRHLWNPTNFGICAMLFLAPQSMALLSHEWGNSPWIIAVIWSVGLMVVWRAKVLHITLTYLAAFALLAAARAPIVGTSWITELIPVTGPMYQLFMFFMITDPRTIPRGRSRQVLVTVLIALLECAIRIACDKDWITYGPLRAAPPMYALFVLGPLAMFLDLQFGAPPPAAVRGAKAAAPRPAATSG